MRTLAERISDHPFFIGMSAKDLAIVSWGASEANFDAGDFVFHEGEPANRFFLIESGTIALEAHEPADGTFLIQHLGPGDVLGWSWLVPPFVWHFQARAIEPAHAIVLDGAHILVNAERNPVFGYNLMKRVTHVVMNRLQATRKRLVHEELMSVLEG